MSKIACLDLEGVLVPEIWIGVADKTGISDLRATTRDISDYSELMRMRLNVCDQNGLTLKDINEVISNMSPLDGAEEFLHWLRENFQVVILSDTFYQFAFPLMQKLDFPALFCHNLEVDDSGRIIDFKLRMKDQKKHAVKAFHSLGFKVIAAGDSYNDTSMLSEADKGILFCPPQNVIDEFPQFQITKDYDELRAAFGSSSYH
ncbi:MAG: bifunctional phosphoserine phosphatase/homoserine phosphotransferase ThrH [Verrucomicrobiota bacterium]|nr:bifunctional phosphoserine phosphatase/homoserine phosphotransferase ThrH [Verrucomicrobiota bacterium]MED5470482.1 bifunctional phosphoserine phosphatase/homoserine phosphotransferase ThrH [Verrucomicrobiota bacterium]MEE2968115.1 bifunctional phosphoserine phosphatase/homoserine phosphotransferase ThrH [Verrucomicrobiota bacterium]|tara:strand:- start:699 stop:1307 length:609 start_codon:yes stop_codon:yes gene_type:complete